MDFAILQYALVLVLMIVLVFVAWQLWCFFAIKLANPILDGLDAPTLSTKMCGSTSNFLDHVSNWGNQIDLPTLPPINFPVSPDMIIQIFIGLGLVFLLISLVMLIGQVLRNSKDDFIELGKAFMKFVGNTLEGIGLLKLIETVRGKVPEKSQSRNIILFLAADPTNESRLRLGEEMREMQENLQLGKFRELFKVEIRPSLRPKDLTRALLNLNPKIVHFSGHGTKEGELLFEDESGESLPVPAPILSNIFQEFASHIQCVILNACYTDKQARAIGRSIKYVIGTNQAIEDKAAIAFSVGFYQGLSEGASVEKSFELGRQLAAIHDKNVKLKLRFLAHKATKVSS